LGAILKESENLVHLGQFSSQAEKALQQQLRMELSQANSFANQMFLKDPIWNQREST
jgi:hypothetical protein